MDKFYPNTCDAAYIGNHISSQVKELNNYKNNIHVLPENNFQQNIEYSSVNQGEPMENSDKRSYKNYKPTLFNLNVIKNVGKHDITDIRDVLKIPALSLPVNDTSAEPPKVNLKERQSPINLDSNIVPVKFQKINFGGYNQMPKVMIATDNGDTVKINADYDCERPYIKGGPLINKYYFEEFHFVWGMNNSVGSEHTYFNARFPMEVHVVHKREDLPFDEALKYSDGFVILCYFMLLCPNDNLGLQMIVDKATEIRNKKTVSIEKFPLSVLFPPIEKYYFHYSGSFTKYPNAECVSWIISTLGLGISQEQLDLFRHIAKRNGKLENNFRKLYMLNGRSLFFCLDSL